MLDDALRTLGLERSLAARVLAIGWATVELDRAAQEFDAAGATQEVPGSVHLGCACRRLAIPTTAITVILLEPTTEGRLAATLARHGEGWAAAWLRVDRADRATTHDLASGPVSATRDGPLGPERLVLGGPVAGPHRLLVEAGTIVVP